MNFDEVWHKCIENSAALLPLPAENDDFIEEEKGNEFVLPKVSNVGLCTLIKDKTARNMTLVILING